MSISPPRHPRLAGIRPTSIDRDILIVQRATELITELGVELDARLEEEDRESERLRLVREATNRITRAANDAVQAYRRARRALEGRGSDGSADAGQRLSEARLDMLRALEIAGRRYPWTRDSGDAADARRTVASAP